MKARQIGYWLSTGLFATAMVGGGLAYLIRLEVLKESMAQLGYPEYLLTILGVAKLLGGVALLMPRTPLLKEWAYAGFTFNILGAAASHALNGDPVHELVAPLIVFATGVASYLLRPASRRLALPTPHPDRPTRATTAPSGSAAGATG